MKVKKVCNVIIVKTANVQEKFPNFVLIFYYFSGGILKFL